MPPFALPVRSTTAPSLPTLTASQFHTLTEIPPALEWFANLTNPNTRRAYRQDLDDFMAFAGLQRPEHFRDVTRAHVIAWRDQLVRQGLANDSIRRKLAALSSLYAYLCERHAVLHNPVLGVKRPRSMNRDGVTPALGDHQARLLLEAPPADTLKGKGDHAKACYGLQLPLFEEDEGAGWDDGAPGGSAAGGQVEGTHGVSG